MTLAYHYLTRGLHAAAVQELPSHPYVDRKRCCVWCTQQQPHVLYDAAAMGQFFGGLHYDPAARHFEPQRPWRELQHKTLTWRPCLYRDDSDPVKYRCPWIDDMRIANLHVHSKQLARFSSVVMMTTT